jgi:hypothetical protein
VLATPRHAATRWGKIRDTRRIFRKFQVARLRVGYGRIRPDSNPAGKPSESGYAQVTGMVKKIPGPVPRRGAISRATCPVTGSNARIGR